MKLGHIALLAGLLISATAVAEKRSADKHEHGHGDLNIAVEGNRVAMELTVPGMDIVGFEHKAKSESDKSAVEKALAVLEKPTALFQMPEAAGCSQLEAKVSLSSDDDHKDHDAKEAEHKDHDHHDAKDAKHDDHDKDDGHAEFHATYLFECKTPAALTTIGFEFFKQFKGAEELTVTVLNEKGQGAFGVSRAKPTLFLSGTN